MDILLETGTGSFLGGFATVNAGTTPPRPAIHVRHRRTNVQLRADASSGDTTRRRRERPFDVARAVDAHRLEHRRQRPRLAARRHRDVQGGGCAVPCTIDFSASGNIVLPPPCRPSPAGTAHHRRIPTAPVPAEHERIRSAARTASSPSRSTARHRRLGLDHRVRRHRQRPRLPQFQFGGSRQGDQDRQRHRLHVAGYYIGTDNTGLTAQPNSTASSSSAPARPGT